MNLVIQSTHIKKKHLLTVSFRAKMNEKFLFMNNEVVGLNAQAENRQVHMHGYLSKSRGYVIGLQIAGLYRPG
jgi:hypothetical protein